MWVVVGVATAAVVAYVCFSAGGHVGERLGREKGYERGWAEFFDHACRVEQTGEHLVAGRARPLVVVSEDDLQALRAAAKKLGGFADDLVEERAKVEALKTVRDTLRELNAEQAGDIRGLRERVRELEGIAVEAGTYDYRPGGCIETPIEFYRIPIPAADPTAATPIPTLWGPV